MELPRFDPTNVAGNYVLDDDGEPREERNLYVWAAWFEDPANHFVLHDRIGRAAVSTIFLSIDHGLFERIINPDAPHTPVLWETMVFGSTPLHHWQRRYTSKLAALQGHRVLCELVERFGLPPRRTKKALQKSRRHGPLYTLRPREQRRVTRFLARLDAHEVRRARDMS